VTTHPLLPFPTLLRGTLVRRYKRFLADIRLDDGRDITAHCPNTGSLLGAANPGQQVYVHAAAGGSLAWRWVLTVTGQGLVGIDTSLPNRFVAAALAQGLLPAFAAYSIVQPEAMVEKGTRLDFRLSGDGLPPCWLEIKNVHLSRTPGLAEFPDSPTERGAKHVNTLAKLANSGQRACVLYVCQRADVQNFALARDIDPAYAAAWQSARAAGVHALALLAAPTVVGLELAGFIPVA
jgi:sugar fermentation stimulation protein A